MRRIAYVIAMAVIACVLAFSQAGNLPDPPGGLRPVYGVTVDPQFGRRQEQTATDRRLEREREKQANKERMLKIKRDTDTLLELATELKDYVDKTNESVLSLQVIRKAEEIEKLAHNIQKKMKND